MIAAAAQAQLPTMLALAEIRTDGGTQSRAELSRDTISDYAEVFTSGAAMPPVIVFYDGDSYWLADGFHRCNGARAAGLTEILADVRQGSRRDAVLFSVGANDTHGLRRTNADKRRAVLLLLNDAEWSGKSDRWIAEKCGVSPQTVSNHREQLSNLDSSPRTGQDGKTRKLPTKPTVHECARHGCQYDDGGECPVCADRDAKGLDDAIDDGPEEDPDIDAAEEEWRDDAPESAPHPVRPEPRSAPTGDSWAALEELAAQREADPDYQSLRRTQAEIAKAMPPTRAQRMIDFVLDGGELALLRLGLDWTVNAETLKAAYRHASKTAHPDRGGKLGEFQALTQARDLVERMLLLGRRSA